jgi:hypothetical protein
MNPSEDPKQMDVHYKNGTLRCKHCKATKRGKWPITLQDLIDRTVDKEIQDFKLVHDYCALQALGHTTN